MSVPEPPRPDTADADFLATLRNGVRVVVARMPWRRTASLSVFVRTGSLHEPRRLNGISHVVEHMAFKGTEARDCQRINLDAERLGAEVNAHTDKDHTAFHVEGLASDLGRFVPMLADIVLHSTFPEAELERERQVIAHELTEYEDDPVAMAFQLFDRACYGDHPAAQPVIGNRANLGRFTRADLLGYVAGRYTAGNIVVAAAGPVDPEAFVREVEAAFGSVPSGPTDPLPEPVWQGGVKIRRMSGSSQCQMVLGYEAPSLHGDHAPLVVAAAVLGEGMSSPLLDELRERRGLAYFASCSADIGPLAGQFVIEAATSPEQAEALLGEVSRLLREQAEASDEAGVERAFRQLEVRALRALESPARRLETAALDVFNFGRLRSGAETIARLRAVSALQVRDAFAAMLGKRGAAALAGGVTARARLAAQQVVQPA